MEAGPNDEILDSVGDDNLAGRSLSRYLRGQVEGNADDPLPDDDHLAGVRNPVRTWRPNPHALRTISSAQRIARAGPSKVARPPSNVREDS